MIDFIKNISAHLNIALEIMGVFFSLIFAILFIYKMRLAWFFSILTSFAYFTLFLQSTLVASTIGSVFFGITSLYILFYSKPNSINKQTDIKVVPVYYNIFYIIVGIALFLCLFSILQPGSDIIKISLDSISVSCMIITIYLFIKRVIYAWSYWILLSMIYAILFFILDRKIIAIGQILNLCLAIYGYYKCKKIVTQTNLINNDNSYIDKNFSE